MLDWFTDFFDWMETLPALWAYVAVLVIAYGENVVPPIPGDMVVVFGGYLVGVGTLSLPLVVLLATTGGALGFMTMYAIGYRIGEAVMDPDRLQWLPKDQIGKAQDWLQRWGYGVVLANRFLSGARSVISLAVGMGRMPAGWVAVYATISALIWTALIAYLGYAVGENWAVVSVYLQSYGRIILGIFILFVVIQLFRAGRRRVVSGESGEEAKP